MTNILSKIRGSGTFCATLVRNTSKLLSRFLTFYNNEGDGEEAQQHEVDGCNDGHDSLPPFEISDLRWPSTSSTSFFAGTPSRSDSQCSCFSCAVPVTGNDRIRRSSKFHENVPVSKYYEFGDLLGEGTFSKVYLAWPRSEPNSLVAIKVIEKKSLRKKIDPNEVDFGQCQWLLDREVQIMSALDHPHIIHLEEVYEDYKEFSFVLELAKGGEVFDRLVEKVAFDESEAATLLVQLLCATAFMHEKGIVHRDIKLENLLYYEDTEDSKIMLADFGLSEYEKELKDGSTICGTPGYLAPEVILFSKCTTAADVWSIGVVAYMLLAGYPPFFPGPNEQDTDQTLFSKIIGADYEFHESAWRNRSPQARDFIRYLLDPDPKKRPTCEEALRHPWLNDKQSLEMRSAQMRNLSSESDEKWSKLQTLSFGLSLFIIIYSYMGLLFYVFNLDEARAYFWDQLLTALEPLITLYDDSFGVASSVLHYFKTC